MRRIGGDYEKDLTREALETVLKEAVVGVAIVSPHSDGVRLDYTNDAFFEIFGYTRDEYENLGADVRLNLFNQADFMNIVSEVNTAHDPGTVMQFEMSINKKGNEKAWVLISTRKPRNTSKDEFVFICYFTDITDMHNLRMEIQAEKEKYEIVEEMSDDIIFNYDVINDVFECSAKILRGLGTRTRIEDAIENITYGDILDHRDVPQFIEALSNALSGKKTNVFDARIINTRGDGIWHRIKFSVIYDGDNAVKFIGTISDIDKEKKEKSRLISQAETDQLTGFLNKLSASLKISETIREYPKDSGALLLLDIDDFKTLNDSYGHKEGDVFLRKFTSKLSLRFGANDILGRIGGEEFVIYISSGGDVDKIKEKAEESAKAVLKICRSVKLENVPERDFSCSVGIAMYPSDGATYNELYERADAAMYSVKRNGKNNFSYFNSEMNNGDE